MNKSKQNPDTINSTQKNRIKLHLCVTCGVPLPENTTIKRCKTCNDKILNTNKERTNKRIEQGKCIRCKNDVEDKRYVKCELCRKYDADYFLNNQKNQRFSILCLECKKVISNDLFCNKCKEKSKKLYQQRCLEKSKIREP